MVLRHAEILEDGELCTEPLRVADARDRYVLAGGDEPETWAPRFTFHGFRYAEVTGPYSDVTAEVCHSDLRRTGWFECSDERVNRLHENVVWGMRGNFLDIPTDCPQRDERLGWTGDLTVFAPTACFLYDVAGFLTSWLADLALEQDDDGVPLVVPCIPGVMRLRTAVWGDAAVEVPSVAVRALRRPRSAGGAVPEHAALARDDHPSHRPARPLGGPLPPRRLARPGGPARRPGRRAHRRGTWSPTPGSATPPAGWRPPPSSSASMRMPPGTARSRRWRERTSPSATSAPTAP